MSELEQLINLLDKLGVGYQRYYDPEFLMKEAVELGAVESVCIRGEVDITFDSSGKSLGNYTNGFGSWSERE